MDWTTAYKDSVVYVVDNDEHICDLIGKLLGLWGMRAESFTDPVPAMNRMKRSCCDVVLLDIFLSGVNGLDLLGEMTGYCPEMRVIAMTGCADKDTAIRALRVGAFDFLEKPLQAGILSHAIYRALDAQRRERELKSALEGYKVKQAELLRYKERLETLNEQLKDTNRALSIFAQNVERERSEVETTIAQRLRSMIVPVVERLGRDKRMTEHANQLAMLVNEIEDLTTNFTADAKVRSLLSPTELRITSLIKAGLTTEQIAEQLHISPNTAKTHRRNIRKKLNINNINYRLRSFLSSAD